VRRVVTRFLTETHAGHCEHFATATTLLLRAAGIPARYAVGYSVQDSARSGDSYIVRQRHAHAWTLAYINGRWTDFDTTPPMWDEHERANTSFFRPISEWFSEMRFRFMLWSFEDHTGLPGKYLFFPLGLLIGFIGWRIFARKRHILLVRKARAAQTKIAYPGLDSEFYQIEARLRRMGLERNPGETGAAWLKRVKRPELNATLELHYRYRFDPASLTNEERAELKREAESWLAT
jgi:protein-glutamine gamma-glutamyltransferase